MFYGAQCVHARVGMDVLIGILGRSVGSGEVAYSKDVAQIDVDSRPLRD